MWTYIKAWWDSKFSKPEPKKPHFIEQYTIPPENVAEILALQDIVFHAHGDWKPAWDLWAAISRAVPAVASNPLGTWVLQRDTCLVYAVRLYVWPQ